MPLRNGAQIHHSSSHLHFALPSQKLNESMTDVLLRRVRGEKSVVAVVGSGSVDTVEREWTRG